MRSQESTTVKSVCRILVGIYVKGMECFLVDGGKLERQNRL